MCLSGLSMLTGLGFRCGTELTGGGIEVGFNETELAGWDSVRLTF